LVVCYLRCRAREVQIAEPGAGSMLYSKALSTVRVDPFMMAGERVKLYQSFATDWCRALDVAPPDFAQRRAEQLRLAPRRSVIEDLLGHRLPPDYAPATL
jgi:hypothetical protein